MRLDRVRNGLDWLQRLQAAWAAMPQPVKTQFISWIVGWAAFAGVGAWITGRLAALPVVALYAFVMCSAALAALVYVRWVEMRLQQERVALNPAEVERRRRLIAQWRSLVHSVKNAERINQSQGFDRPTLTYLEGRADFEALRPYLNDDERHQILGRTMRVPPGNSEMSYVLYAVVEAVNRLEGDWGLRVLDKN